MNIIAPLVSPASFQIGIRAVSRQIEPTLRAATTRRLSGILHNIPGTCHPYSTTGLSGPLRTLRHQQWHRQLLPRTAIRTVFKFRAIIHYAQLPNDYEDANGLPFRKEELKQNEVQKIFGSHMSAAEANKLLKVIHGRRVAGTLDDPDLQENTAAYRTADKVKALEYLRKNIPVDEIINAGLRAEDELRILEEDEREQENQDREQQHEETSPQSTPPVEEAKERSAVSKTQSSRHLEEKRTIPTGRLPRKDDSAYGEGVFDRIRKRNEARYEQEQQRLEEERIKREEEEAAGKSGPLQTRVRQPTEISPWRKKHAERATSDLEAPPDMKAWERLLPSATFALLILGIGVVCAAYYKPPTRDWRIWPDLPPATATVIGLILVNLAVFALWKFPPVWAILNRYGLLVVATPKPFQLIGAVFSHQSLSHMFANLVVLWFFGVRLHDEIGRGNFLALYFTCGSMGFLSTLFHSVLTGGLHLTSLGASGAIWGIVAAYFWIHMKDEFKFAGLPPDPLSGPSGAVFLGLVIGLHVWMSLSTRSRIALDTDLASHWGGIITGLLGIEWIMRYLDQKARDKAEKLSTMGMLDKMFEARPLVQKHPVDPTNKSSDAEPEMKKTVVVLGKSKHPDDDIPK